MTKAYRLPVLLIEFDRDRAFVLQVATLYLRSSGLASLQVAECWPRLLWFLCCFLLHHVLRRHNLIST